MNRVKDTDSQNEAITAVRENKNVIIRASAGTGKTYTLIKAIEEDLKLHTDFQQIAAITYTIKATKEIRDRIKGLKIDDKQLKISTNNEFIRNEIIIPFIGDAYKKKFSNKLSSDYSIKFSSFDEGINSIEKMSIIGEYTQTKKDSFHYELALEIIKKSKACQRYVKSKYRRIYIDEYQDVSNAAHSFYKYLLYELGIKLFIVGDTKQNIFSFAGAAPKFFNEFWNNEKHLFLREELTFNRRCSNDIQNYSNLLFDETRKLILTNSDYIHSEKDVICICLHKNEIQKWPQIIKNCINSKLSLALFRIYNEDCKKSVSLLRKMADISLKFIPKNPLSEFPTELQTLFFSIGCFAFNNKYNIYNFLSDTQIGETNFPFNIHLVEQKLRQIKEAPTQYETSETIYKLGVELGCIKIDSSKNDVLTIIHKFVQILTNTEYQILFTRKETRSVCQTVYTAKGLTYDQVIIFASDFNESNKETHYVAATRAKSKLLIVLNTDEDSDYIKFMRSRIQTSPIISSQNIIEFIHPQSTKVSNQNFT